MLDNLHALSALHDHATMARAALSLHITQSAVSKRIASLELDFKQTLIERMGRRVRLTPAGLSLLERARPLMEGLKEVFLEEQSIHAGNLRIAVSVSVLLSGGAQILGTLRNKYPKLTLDIRAHHASLSVELVRSGECMLAFVQGKSEMAPDLRAVPVFEQEVVIVPSGLKRLVFPKHGTIDVITIDEYTEAWRFTKRALDTGKSIWGVRFTVQDTLDSFSAIAEMAKAGFGHGLVPLGVARALGIPAAKLVRFPKPGVHIPVSLIGRESTLAKPLIQEFHKELVRLAKEPR